LSQSFGPCGDLKREHLTALRERWFSGIRLQVPLAGPARRHPLWGGCLLLDSSGPWDR